MLLSVLTEKLKIDAGDDTLGWNTLRRCFERAAVQVNQDFSANYVIAGNDAADTTILPDPTSLHQELLLILSMMHLVGMGRISASDAISFKSGDKAVDRTRTALSKKEIYADLWLWYLNLAGLDQETLVTGEPCERAGGDVDFTAERRNYMT